MNASYRQGQRNIRERRNAAKKRSISTYVARVTEDQQARETVTAALRAKAKTLRESGALGRVQQRTCRVTPDHVGVNYRYNARQIAEIAAAYRPRKDAYKAARVALMAA